MLRLGDSDGETVANIDVQHDVDIRAAVSYIHDVVRPDLLLGLQLVESRYFTVAGSGASDRFNLAALVVEKFGSVDVSRRNDSLQGRLNDLHRRGRENIKIEVITINATLKNFIKQRDVCLQTNRFTRLDQVFLANSILKLGIMQQ